MFCKRVVYTAHVLFIGGTLFGWVAYKPMALLMPVVGLSWELNDNQCLLTQLEERWFGEVLIPGRIPILSKMFLWTMFVYVLSTLA